MFSLGVPRIKRSSLGRHSSFDGVTTVRQSSSTESFRSSIRSVSIDSVVGYPHDDPLPTTAAELEGRLNDLASQLQKMVGRVEALNEMIDLEGIVLARLERDHEEALKKFAEGIPKVSYEVKNKKHLITDLKKCKKGMERSVMWQRDEYKRVERAMGKKVLGLENKGEQPNEATESEKKYASHQ
jgi:hypothetical protein